MFCEGQESVLYDTQRPTVVAQISAYCSLTKPARSLQYTTRLVYSLGTPDQSDDPIPPVRQHE